MAESGVTDILVLPLILGRKSFSHATTETSHDTWHLLWKASLSHNQIKEAAFCLQLAKGRVSTRQMTHPFFWEEQMKSWQQVLEMLFQNCSNRGTGGLPITNKQRKEERGLRRHRQRNSSSFFSFPESHFSFHQPLNWSDPSQHSCIFFLPNFHYRWQFYVPRIKWIEKHSSGLFAVPAGQKITSNLLGGDRRPAEPVLSRGPLQPMPFDLVSRAARYALVFTTPLWTLCPSPSHFLRAAVPLESPWLTKYQAIPQEPSRPASQETSDGSLLHRWFIRTSSNNLLFCLHSPGYILEGKNLHVIW